MAASYDDPHTLAEGTLVAGKYRIETALGQGGMGTVYRATNSATGRRVALKWMLDPTAELRGRMKLEALAMGAIDHPNVVQVLDAGEHEGSFFLVMELLRGRSLREELDLRALPLGEALAILIRAMQGVEAAHAVGLIHRDLKPDNLFLTFDEHGAVAGVKLLDFGIARPVREENAQRGITRSGAIIGTPRYMAPEQILGNAVDARTDIFALGVIAYELVTGRPPFESERYEALILAIATQTPPPPMLRVPGLPEGLSRAIMRALERDPDARFPTVASFAQALEPFAGVRFHAPTARPSMVPPSRPMPTSENVPTREERPTTPILGTVPAGLTQGERMTAATRPARPLDPGPTSAPWSEAGGAFASTGEARAVTTDRSIEVPLRRPWLGLAVAAVTVAVVSVGYWLTRPAPAPTTVTVPMPRLLPSVPANANPPNPPPIPAPSAPAGEPTPPPTPTDIAPTGDATPTAPVVQAAPTGGRSTSGRRAAPSTPAAPAQVAASPPPAPPPPSPNTVEVRSRAGVIRTEDF